MSLGAVMFFSSVKIYTEKQSQFLLSAFRKTKKLWGFEIFVSHSEASAGNITVLLMIWDSRNIYFIHIQFAKKSNMSGTNYLGDVLTIVFINLFSPFLLCFI